MSLRRNVLGVAVLLSALGAIFAPGALRALHRDVVGNIEVGPSGARARFVLNVHFLDSRCFGLVVAPGGGDGLTWRPGEIRRRGAPLLYPQGSNFALLLPGEKVRFMRLSEASFDVLAANGGSVVELDSLSEDRTLQTALNECFPYYRDQLANVDEAASPLLRKLGSFWRRTQRYPTPEELRERIREIEIEWYPEWSWWYASDGASFTLLPPLYMYASSSQRPTLVLSNVAVGDAIRSWRSNLVHEGLWSFALNPSGVSFDELERVYPVWDSESGAE